MLTRIRTIASLLEKYISGPMKMNDTKLEIINRDKICFAKGYNSEGKLMPTPDWWKYTPAVGYIKSTIGDMVKYLDLNINQRDAAIILAHHPIGKINEEGALNHLLFHC